MVLTDSYRINSHLRQINSKTDKVDSMPPQASPVVDRACRLAHEHTYATNGVETVDHSLNVPKVKCVLIGDGAIGKTSLVVSYTTNGYPTEYIPTAFDNYSVEVTVDNRPIRLQLCDTAGQDDFDTLRPLCYPGTDVFLICFSVVSPTSFANISQKWVDEVYSHCRVGTPLVLVGTQCDLRSDVKKIIELAHFSEKPVSEQQAKSLAKSIGASAYIECSALTQKNLKRVFDTALLLALEHHDMIPQTRKKLKKLSKKKKRDYKCDESRRHLKTFSSVASTSSRSSSDPNLQDSQKRGFRKLCCFL